MATIRDVARRAEVSAASVSRVLNYQGLIFVGYSTLWYQKKVFRQVVQGKLP